MDIQTIFAAIKTEQNGQASTHRTYIVIRTVDSQEFSVPINDIGYYDDIIFFEDKDANTLTHIDTNSITSIKFR